MARPKHRHPWLRRMLGIGVLVGTAYAVWRAIETNRVETDSSWEPQPFPFPPQPRADAAERAELASERAPAAEVPSAAASEREEWVEPADGACPTSHPVKAKLTSGIFHVPGGISYDRTSPDRCYLDPAAAEADGLRAAKN